MRTTRTVWWLLLAAGTTAFALTLALPWREEDLPLGAGVRVVMALAGAILLVLVARTPSYGPVVGVGVLGAAVLAYPTLLGLAAAEVGGPGLRPVLGVLGAAGHVVPLTLVQLVPLLASARAVGRGHRRWEALVVAVAVAGALLTGLALAGATVLVLPSTVLWFGSFAIAPTVTWVAVRGVGGEARHRAVVAALAALVPVVVIAWCVALGVLAGGPGGPGDGGSLTALLLGFSAGTLLCGVLALGACAPDGSVVLRTGVVVGLLHAVLTALALIVGSVAALTAATVGVPAVWAVPLGAAAALTVGLPWLRLHAWTSRMVDPGVELRHDLAALGSVAPGRHRQALLHALRRVTGDPALDVLYAVTPGVLVGADDEPADPGTGPLTTLARQPDDTPAVLARSTTPSGTRRLQALGDCADVVQPALLEARLGQEARRADAAAEAERRRLSQDLHDGLQGRLLGLALHVQLGARSLDDPTAALLSEETVAALRSAVDDVRALGGGRLPDVLVRDGLGPALSALLRPAGPLVELDLPGMRFGAQAEATTYFLVAEAVANALKHADARRIGVQVRVEGERVEIEVADDGCGGADPRLGSGLRGLAERVGACGGALVVREGSPGTTVEAVLPCGS